MTILWEPDAAQVAGGRLAAFCRAVADDRGIDLPDSAALWRWSVDEPGAFWAAVWDHGGVIGDRGDRLVEPAAEMRHTRFLPDARLNVADTLLGAPTDDLALSCHDEEGPTATWTRRRLHDEVSRVQQALRELGIGAGDRVAAWLPNVAETQVLMLAAASIGAVFSSTSPDFGTEGVLDRFGQIEPAVLVATEAYRYNGTTHDCRPRLAEIVAALPSLRATITIGEAWERWVAPHPVRPVTTEPLPFDHPWYVLYSSGTTGKPKCIVHRAGGVLLKHITEHQLHCDVRPGDRVFYFTTGGWMMWNWLASALGSEATIVLYDGSPFHPDGNRLWQLADEVGMTLFGTSAPFLDACAKAGLAPGRTHDLGTVRTICSTGSPLVAETFDYVYRDIKADVHLASISGGTDLCGCLVGGDPTVAVHRGEIQGPAFGLDIDIVDLAGAPLPDGVQGELICRNPFPSMPLRFWNDPDDTRYKAAYFDTIPGVWHHGDFAERTSNGGYVITGRSDATLNPGGVRIGTAEIYRQLAHIDEVLEGLVIGQQVGGDTRIVLFVRLADGVTLDGDLVDRIRRQIRTGASPRHVPAVTIAVDDLPRTRSGKLSELAVRDVVHGRTVANTEALANPEALALFVDLPDLQV